MEVVTTPSLPCHTTGPSPPSSPASCGTASASHLLGLMGDEQGTLATSHLNGGTSRDCPALSKKSCYSQEPTVDGLKPAFPESLDSKCVQMKKSTDQLSLNTTTTGPIDEKEDHLLTGKASSIDTSDSSEGKGEDLPQKEQQTTSEEDADACQESIPNENQILQEVGKNPGAMTILDSLPAELTPELSEAEDEQLQGTALEEIDLIISELEESQLPAEIKANDPCRSHTEPVGQEMTRASTENEQKANPVPSFAEEKKESSMGETQTPEETKMAIDAQQGKEGAGEQHSPTITINLTRLSGTQAGWSKNDVTTNLWNWFAALPVREKLQVIAVDDPIWMRLYCFLYRKSKRRVKQQSGVRFERQWIHDCHDRLLKRSHLPTETASDGPQLAIGKAAKDSKPGKTAASSSEGSKKLKKTKKTGRQMSDSEPSPEKCRDPVAIPVARAFVSNIFTEGIKRVAASPRATGGDGNRQDSGSVASSPLSGDEGTANTKGRTQAEAGRLLQEEVRLCSLNGMLDTLTLTSGVLEAPSRLHTLLCDSSEGGFLSQPLHEATARYLALIQHAGLGTNGLNTTGAARPFAATLGVLDTQWVEAKYPITLWDFLVNRLELALWAAYWRHCHHLPPIIDPLPHPGSLLGLQTKIPELLHFWKTLSAADQLQLVEGVPPAQLVVAEAVRCGTPAQMCAEMVVDGLLFAPVSWVYRDEGAAVRRAAQRLQAAAADQVAQELLNDLDLFEGELDDNNSKKKNKGKSKKNSQKKKNKERFKEKRRNSKLKSEAGQKGSKKGSQSPTVWRRKVSVDTDSSSTTRDGSRTPRRLSGRKTAANPCEQSDIVVDHYGNGALTIIVDRELKSEQQQQRESESDCWEKVPMGGHKRRRNRGGGGGGGAQQQAKPVGSANSGTPKTPSSPCDSPTKKPSQERQVAYRQKQSTEGVVAKEQKTKPPAVPPGGTPKKKKKKSRRKKKKDKQRQQQEKEKAALLEATPAGLKSEEAPAHPTHSALSPNSGIGNQEGSSQQPGLASSQPEANRRASSPRLRRAKSKEDLENQVAEKVLRDAEALVRAQYQVQQEMDYSAGEKTKQHSAVPPQLQRVCSEAAHSRGYMTQPAADGALLGFRPPPRPQAFNGSRGYPAAEPPKPRIFVHAKRAPQFTPVPGNGGRAWSSGVPYNPRPMPIRTHMTIPAVATMPNTVQGPGPAPSHAYNIPPRLQAKRGFPPSPATIRPTFPVSPLQSMGHKQLSEPPRPCSPKSPHPSMPPSSIQTPPSSERAPGSVTPSTPPTAQQRKSVPFSAPAASAASSESSASPEKLPMRRVRSIDGIWQRGQALPTTPKEQGFHMGRHRKTSETERYRRAPLHHKTAASQKHAGPEWEESSNCTTEDHSANPPHQSMDGSASDGGCSNSSHATRSEDDEGAPNSNSIEETDFMVYEGMVLDQYGYPSRQLTEEEAQRFALEHKENKTLMTKILNENIEDFLGKAKRVMAPRRKARDRVMARVKHLVHNLWEEAIVEVYGSCYTGLDLPSSDVDIVIRGLGSPNLTQGKFVSVEVVWLQQLANVLQEQEWIFGMKVIETASIPVIKLLADPQPINDETANNLEQEETEVWYGGGSQQLHVPLDISFESPMHAGLTSSIYVRRACQEGKYPELFPLTLVLKELLSQRGLNQPWSGGLSSYSLALLLITVLKRRNERLKNVVQESEESCLGEILVEFLEFVGRQFDPSRFGIEVLEGDEYVDPLFELEQKFDPRTGLSLLDPLFIKDPMDTYKNTAKACYGFMQVQWQLAQCVAMLEVRGSVLARTDPDANILQLLLYY